MGLDVYVNYHEDFPFWSQKEQTYHTFSEQIWEEKLRNRKWEDLAESEKDQINALCKKLALDLDLTEHGEVPGEFHHSIEEKSKTNPDHIFKIGYFRSSYNGSGINNYLNQRIGKNLYDLGVPENSYQFVPDWWKWLDNARTMRREIVEWLAENGDCRVFSVSMNPTRGPGITSEGEALDAFIAEKERFRQGKAAFDRYSNSVGEFNWGKPEQIRAVIPGRDILKQPCVYIVADYGGDSDDHEWYVQALDIVIETCEFVLAQGDPGKYVVTWSS